jgi:hypothetical protein
MERYARSFRARVEREFGHATSARDKLRRLVEVQLPLCTDDVDEWSVWVQFWSQAMLEPRLRPVQRLVYSDWRRVVVDLLGKCREEGLCGGADVEALADRFIAMAEPDLVLTGCGPAPSIPDTAIIALPIAPVDVSGNSFFSKGQSQAVAA